MGLLLFTINLNKLLLKIEFKLWKMEY
jgi:hypothetical protein